MGFMDFLSGMAKNPMTYYASSMLGGALGGPNSFGGRLSQGTMPLIANKAGGTDFLKMILGQGGKATMDKESVKINMPASSEIAQQMLGGQRQIGQGTMSGNMPVAPTMSDIGQQVLGGQGMDVSGYNAVSPTQLGSIPSGQATQLNNIPSGQLALMQYMLGGSGNPFSSLGISAGSPWLTPEMLSQALQLRLAGEQFGHKQMIDQFNMMQQMQPKLIKPTADIQNFEYAKASGFKGSFEEWSRDVPSYIQYYDEAVKGGYEGTFHEWFREMQALGGGLSLEEKVEQKGALDTVGRQSEVKAPDFHQKVQEDLMKDTRAWRSSAEAETRAKAEGVPFEEARGQIQKAKVINEMGKRIRAAYAGQSVEARSDGWYVDNKLVVRNPYYVGQ